MSEPGKQDQAGGTRQPAVPAPEPEEKSARDAHLDERLDEALDETFPASDPIAVHEPRTERSTP